MSIQRVKDHLAWLKKNVDAVDSDAERLEIEGLGDAQGRIAYHKKRLARVRNILKRLLDRDGITARVGNTGAATADELNGPAAQTHPRVSDRRQDG